MPRLVGIRQIWTFLIMLLVSIAALPLGYWGTDAIMHRPDAGTGERVAAVVIGLGSLVPLLSFVIWSYRRSDEFERHQILLQLAVAFALCVLFNALVDVLQYTGVLEHGAFSPRWLLCFLAWAVAVLLVSIHARIRK